jgi:leucine dehydrogenase
MVAAHRKTPYVLDLPPEQGGVGEFTPMAVSGVIWGLCAAARYCFGNASLNGKNAAIQGLGALGMGIARALQEQGTNVVGCDIDPNRAAYAWRAGIRVVPPEGFLFRETDFLIPCATGDQFTRETASRVRARVICGPANNQLTENSVADVLKKRDILYLPDFIVGAGAILLDDALVNRHPVTINEGIGRTRRIYDKVNLLLPAYSNSKHSLVTLAYQHMGGI